jgi:hypothetical protein
MRERKAKKPNTRATSAGTTSTSKTAQRKESEPVQYQGSCLPVEEDHEVRQVGLVAAVAPDLAHQVHAEGVAAEGEEEAVAEREDAGVAPDQVHGHSDDGVAHDLADQGDDIGRDMEGIARRHQQVQRRQQHQGDRRGDRDGDPALLWRGAEETDNEGLAGHLSSRRSGP